MPLLREHWREVAHFKDIPLDVDVDAYLTAARNDALRIFTARHYYPAPVVGATDILMPDSELVGYAVFFVRPNPHYRGSVQASCDVIYMHPKVRAANAIRFLAFCDRNLSYQGVDVVYHRVKVAKDWGKILARLGYDAIDVTYGKRLHREAREQSDTVSRDEAHA